MLCAGSGRADVVERDEAANEPVGHGCARFHRRRDREPSRRRQRRSIQRALAVERRGEQAAEEMSSLRLERGSRGVEQQVGAADGPRDLPLQSTRSSVPVVRDTAAASMKSVGVVRRGDVRRGRGTLSRPAGCALRRTTCMIDFARGDRRAVPSSASWQTIELGVGLRLEQRGRATRSARVGRRAGQQVALISRRGQRAAGGGAGAPPPSTSASASVIGDDAT